MASPSTQEDQLQQQADDWLRDVVRRCARIYRSLCIHAHRDAVAERLGLPEEIKECSWGLEVIARATYEMANYTIVSCLGRLVKKRRPDQGSPDAHSREYDNSNHIVSNTWSSSRQSCGTFKTHRHCHISLNH